MTDDSMFESIEEDYLRRIAEKSYQEKSFDKQMSFEDFHKFAMQEIKNPNKFKDKESGCVYRQIKFDDSFLQVLEDTYYDFTNNHKYSWNPEDEACVSNFAYGTISKLCDDEIDYMIKKFKWQHFNEGHITDFLPGGKNSVYAFTCKDEDKPYPTTEEEFEILQEEKQLEVFKKTYIENGFEDQLSLDDFLTLSRQFHQKGLTNYYIFDGEIDDDDEIDDSTSLFRLTSLRDVAYLNTSEIQDRIMYFTGEGIHAAKPYIIYIEEGEKLCVTEEELRNGHKRPFLIVLRKNMIAAEYFWHSPLARQNTPKPYI